MFDDVEKTYELIEVPEWRDLLHKHLINLRTFLSGNVPEKSLPAVTGRSLTGLPASELAFSVLRSMEFRECLFDAQTFNECNFMEAELFEVYARRVTFVACSLAYARFHDCVFTGADFTNSGVQCARFIRCNLTDADLANCDLAYATFTGSLLEGAELPAGVPVVKNIDASILEEATRPGHNLDMDDWHRCETTHCRAGWAIHLAGKAGYALAKRMSNGTAGALIYAASAPSLPIPNWYATNDEAMADMQKRAKLTI